MTDNTVDPALIEGMATTVNTVDTALEAIVNPPAPPAASKDTVI